MTVRRSLLIGAFAVAIAATTAHAQDLSKYREFALGGSLAAVAAQSGTAAAQAKTIHERPAVMQELEWRPSYFVSGSNVPQTDPVRQIVFSFYDDQLYKVAVDYDSQRTEGLSAVDVIEALSSVYGPTSKPTVKRTASATVIEQDADTPIARWEDADSSVVLYRAPFASSFRVIVTSRRLAALARTADTQALRLDAREAPQREITRQKKEAADARTSQEKARAANKAAFRP